MPVTWQTSQSCASVASFEFELAGVDVRRFGVDFSGLFKTDNRRDRTAAFSFNCVAVGCDDGCGSNGGCVGFN